MKCAGCQNDRAYRVVTIYRDGQLLDSCDRCAALEPSTIHDVYWPGHAHYNSQLVDKFGKPILITSKAHKAQILKEKGLIEAGDRVRGAPSGSGLGNWRT